MHSPTVTRKRDTTRITFKIQRNVCDIFIGAGLRKKAGKIISGILGTVRVALLTDGNVATHYLLPLTDTLSQEALRTTSIVVPPGEKTKNPQVFHDLVMQLLAEQHERGHAVIALGGGMIGDLAGFVAGVTRRGMPFVQIPTTLLAQVDSSIGGKTGVNTPYGKNLMGMFHQPRLVICDTDTLNTLPERTHRAGYAEVLKYALINRPDSFFWLEKNFPMVLKEGEARCRTIEICCLAKIEQIIKDERDENERLLLNFGHTFAHALEAATGYDDERLMHGEAVAIGMVLALRFSACMKKLRTETVTRIEKHLQAVGLPTRIDQIPGEMPSPERLLGFMAQDKKLLHGTFTFILAHDIGKVFIAKNITEEDILPFLNQQNPAYI